MEEKLLLLGLYLKQKGTFRATKWLEEFPEVEALLKEYQEKPSHLKELAERELERAQKAKIQLLFIKDEAFPQELKEIPYPPIFLYVKGNLPQGKKFAIVGTRKPTPYGKEVANLFAEALLEGGLILVSGLARGIDTIVHRVSVEKKGQTIAILGSGLDVIYPPENRELYHQILETGGAVISEFPLGTKPRKENFPRRNRLITGLSLGVLVIEAGERSGTLITAKWAQEQGKEVFAVPGNIFSVQSRGTNFLLKEGAIPVSHPREILEYYGIDTKPSKTPSKREEKLSSEEELLLSLLSEGPLHFEVLVERSSLSAPELLQILTELEFKGIIKSLPGKFYQKALS